MSHTTADKELLKALGARITELRKNKGWSQEHLSFECGLDRTYVSAVERGRRNISIVNLNKIAKALAKDLSELVSWDIGKDT